jgi:DNA-binding CsgD family transcriptional regulator
MVLLDDVHLADASSWEALHYLARNLGGAGVLLIATARPGELAASRLATEIFLDLEQEGLLTRIVLKPLTADALSELAAGVLSATPPPELMDWLAERSRGNPLFALGLLRALLEEGADLSAPALQELPQSLSERVALRLRRLDQPAMTTLDVLAVVGQQVDLSDLVLLSNRPLDRLAEILEQLVRAHLVTEDRTGPALAYEITHPLVAEAIYAGIGGARQQALHRLVGRAFLETGRLGQAAPHFVRSAAPGDNEAIEALSAAVRQAEDRQTFREAMALLASLAELLPPGDDRWLNVFDAMARRAEWVVDHRVEADAVLAIGAMRQIEAVLDRLPDPARRAAAKYRLTTFLAYGAGEIEDAGRLGREALHLYEEAGDRAGALLAAVELAWVAGIAGDFRTMEAEGRRLRAEAEAAGEQAVAVQAGAAVGFAAGFLGRFAAAEEAYRQAAATATAVGNRFRLTFIRSILAVSLAFGGRLSDACDELDGAQVADPAYRENVLLNWAAFVRYLGGDFHGSLAAGLEASAQNPGRISRRRGVGTMAAAMAALELGELEVADNLLNRTWAAYDGRHWFLMLDTCAWVQAALDWRRDHRSEALGCLQRTSERVLGLEAWPWSAIFLVDLAEMAANGGDAELTTSAAADLASAAAGVDRDGLLHPLAGIGLAWALLTAGDASGAAMVAGDAANVLERLGYQGYRGRALDVAGRSLARAGNRAGAVAALESAADVFSRIGAVWRRDRVLDALSQLGGKGRRAAGAIRGPASLTRREREVAGLAATGLTAGEVAARLFLSERTVEYHLANAYAKLGVDSKLDLVRRAAELGLA